MNGFVNIEEEPGTPFEGHGIKGYRLVQPFTSEGQLIVITELGAIVTFPPIFVDDPANENLDFIDIFFFRLNLFLELLKECSSLTFWVDQIKTSILITVYPLLVCFEYSFS